MSLVRLNKTGVMSRFDSGWYKGLFEVSSEYLTDFWFAPDHIIWDRISVQFAAIVEKEIKEQMKDKMNPESYKEIFLKGGKSV